MSTPTGDGANVTEPTIEEREADVQRKRQDLAVAEKGLLDARIAVSGVAVGDIVLDRYGKRHRVEVIMPFAGRPWVDARPERKGKSWGRVQHLYSEWRHVAPGEGDGK